MPSGFTSSSSHLITNIISFQGWPFNICCDMPECTRNSMRSLLWTLRNLFVMVCILFVGVIKTQQTLGNNYFIASYNLFHQEVGSMPPNLPSTIFEDLVAHTSKSEVSGKFPHERIIVLDPLKQQHVLIPPHPSPTPPAFLNVWKS